MCQVRVRRGQSPWVRRYPGVVRGGARAKSLGAFPYCLGCALGWNCLRTNCCFIALVDENTLPDSACCNQWLAKFMSARRIPQPTDFDHVLSPVRKPTALSGPRKLSGTRTKYGSEDKPTAGWRSPAALVRTQAINRFGLVAPQE